MIDLNSVLIDPDSVKDSGFFIYSLLSYIYFI